MRKILSTDDAAKLSEKLHTDGEKIVVAGGCFDIIHVGHIRFLQAAKKHGDTLILLVESDRMITQRKGPKRPINTQQDRAVLLSALSIVDYIVPLPDTMHDRDYDELILKLKPAIIATTANDPHRMHKDRQAALIKGKVVEVIDTVHNKSTTRLTELLEDML